MTHRSTGSDCGEAEEVARDGETSPPRASGATPSTRRRQLLKSVAAPAAATAISGCSALESGEDPLVDDLEPGDTTGYGGAIRFGETYAMTVTSAADGTTTLAGRFHGEDRYIRLEEEEDGPLESYLVDGDGYVVVGGECTAYPDLDAGLRSVGSVDPPEESDADPELTMTGRETIDGRTMLVLESEGDGPASTYYVDEETRYLRRIETDASVVDYRSWGSVDPIEPPDADCRQAPERTTPTG